MHFVDVKVYSKRTRYAGCQRRLLEDASWWLLSVTVLLKLSVVVRACDFMMSFSRDVTSQFSRYRIP